MKLKPKEHLHPEQLRLTLPGEVARDLQLFMQYQAEHGVTWEPKDLLVEILRAFLDEGDRAFLQWKKTRHNHRTQLTDSAPTDTPGESRQDATEEMKASIQDSQWKTR